MHKLEWWPKPSAPELRIGTHSHRLTPKTSCALSPVPSPLADCPCRFPSFHEVGRPFIQYTIAGCIGHDCTKLSKIHHAHALQSGESATCCTTSHLLCLGVRLSQPGLPFTFACLCCACSIAGANRLSRDLCTAPLGAHPKELATCQPLWSWSDGWHSPFCPLYTCPVPYQYAPAVKSGAGAQTLCTKTLFTE